MDEKRLDNIENKLNDIHKALMGDQYGNKGFMQRLCKVEQIMKKYEKMLYMVIGGATALSFVINIIFNIL